MARRRVRPRRHHRRPADVVAVAGHRAQRTALSRGHAKCRHLRRQRRRARQDPQRGARRRHRAKLLRRRHHAAVRAARRRLLRAHRGPRFDRRELWPAITAALRWIDVYGDIDGDGFVETRPRGASPPQHGWKSSPDAVFHADGRIATGPLALCEVQGYVYGAKLAAARIARSLGEMPRAIALVEAAQALQAKFNRPSGAGHRDLRDGARWRQTTLPGAHVEPGPLPVHRHRACRARPPGDRRAGRRALVLRLGRAHGGGERTALQPDVLSQRFRLAARQSLLAAGAARYDDKAFALRILNAQFEAA